MRHVLLTVVVAAAVAGCGSNSDSVSETIAQTTTTASQAASTPTATTAPAKTTPVVEDEAKPDKQAAIDVVKADLPDIPLYEGATYKATVIGDAKVCVDQTLSKSNAAAVGGNRTSHRTVTFPDESIGEAQDGPCAKRAETANRKLQATKTFYLKMDDLALDLEDAVEAAQNDAPGAAGRIGKVRSRILTRVNNHLLDGGDTSIGGNLLLSAATTARDAAKSGDQARLADQRREIADARNKLAEEAIG
jgi:hypothetical protein